MGALDGLNKLNDICLFVSDFQGSLKFFTEKFGFRIKRLQPDAERANYAEFDFQGASVTMWEKSGGVYEAIGERYVEGPGHPFMIAIRVPEAGDVDEIYRELGSRGVECLLPPTTFPFGARASYYH
ncbi:MAG: VOC family protein, partial [Synergistaceae bacterium]|nr:VOC family protein [Synergistaceae bacterium]